ncbi:HipA family kinase [Parvibium lacunae]|uniref:HipA-like kinase domain-containing protein n=1 Tax=Parvibium lacunae TaxID=1888893 RepID=A0A368L3X3_9BURK|nr:HipA family kinase [Parvibium lacunae]RCS58183.1 hypothetical protein DU000_04980 [Parvibium lacunae]
MTEQTIVEILGRSEQGMTRPFICRAADGAVYFVKGAGAGKRSLWCEWLAGQLAQRVGLPIAPFCLLAVPDELLALGRVGEHDLSDLGPGLVFGSRRSEVVELNASIAEKIPPDLQAAVAVFDWWVRNMDRSLSRQGGNPNLFWESDKASLLVIDHNLAFADDFEVQHFLETHVFAAALKNLASDFLVRAEMAQRLQEALTAWPQIVASVPPLWHYLDAEMTNPYEFDLQRVYTDLARVDQDDFWSLM